MKDIYILGAKQISIQKPLCEEWMDSPELYGKLTRAAVIDPDYKQFFPPNMLRRLGPLLKRALLTSRQVMEGTGILSPDAILTGTGFGCVENTEIFLEAMTFEGEECLKPTCFMQSTHNTIGSLIAIEAHCHGYNSTYTNKGLSFECALTDAMTQFGNGRIKTALVGAYDEITEHYLVLLGRTGYVGDGSGCLCGEAAVSMMLAVEPSESAICRIKGIEMHYGTEIDELEETLKRLLSDARCSLDEVDAIMTGINGNEANDAVYKSVCHKLFPDKDLLFYKHLFGEIHSASGLGTYAVASCLGRNRIPDFLFVGGKAGKKAETRNIIFYNQYGGKNHSFILLSSCGR